MDETWIPDFQIVVDLSPQTDYMSSPHTSDTQVDCRRWIIPALTPASSNHWWSWLG